MAQLKKKSITKLLWSSFGAVLLLVLAYFMFIKKPGMEVTVQSDVVTRETLTRKISATGTINPIETIEVGTQVSGTIENLYVDFNDQVSAGQVIARMDSRNLDALVKESEYNLARTGVQLNQAQRNYDRMNKLFSAGSIPKSEFEVAEDELKLALALHHSAQLQLERNQVNLSYAVIRSPIDGIVISRRADEGQTLAAAFATPAIYVIAGDLRKMKIEASVDEADIGQVHQGQKVQFTVDAYPDELFYGVVDLIQLQPVTFQNVVTYTVEVMVDNDDLKLMPGMTATLEVIISQRDQVLAVPNGIFQFEMTKELADQLKEEDYVVTALPNPSSTTAWKKEGQNFTEVTVTPGFSNGIKTEITGDIQEGDTLVSHAEVHPARTTSSFIMPQNTDNKSDK